MRRRLSAGLVIDGGSVGVAALTAAQTAGVGPVRWVALAGIAVVSTVTALTARRALRRDRR